MYLYSSNNFDRLCTPEELDRLLLSKSNHERRLFGFFCMKEQRFFSLYYLEYENTVMINECVESELESMNMEIFLGFLNLNLDVNIHHPVENENDDEHQVDLMEYFSLPNRISAFSLLESIHSDRDGRRRSSSRKHSHRHNGEQSSYKSNKTTSKIPTNGVRKTIPLASYSSSHSFRIRKNT